MGVAEEESGNSELEKVDAPDNKWSGEIVESSSSSGDAFVAGERNAEVDADDEPESESEPNSGNVATKSFVGTAIVDIIPDKEAKDKEDNESALPPDTIEEKVVNEEILQPNF